MSKLAVDLSTNRYIESKIHYKYKQQEDEKEKLFESVPYVLLNFKDAILKNKMDELNRQIKAAEKTTTSNNWPCW